MESVSKSDCNVLAPVILLIVAGSLMAAFGGLLPLAVYGMCMATIG